MSTCCTIRKKRCWVMLIALLTFALAQAQPTLPVKEQAIELLKKNIIASGLNQNLLGSYLVTDAYQDRRSGNFLLYLQQTYLGVPVYNKIGVYIFRHDTLVQKRPNYIGLIPEATAVRAASYNIDPAQAIRLAADHLAIAVSQSPQLLRRDAVRKRFVYAVAGLAADSTTADLVWLPLNNNKEIRLSWNIRIASPNGHDDWFVRIDAQTGAYLDKNSLVLSEQNKENCIDAALSVPPIITSSPGGKVSTALAPPAVTSAAYRVYPYPLESPNFGERSLEMNPWLKAGAGNNAATLGWHFDNTTDYTITRGNNVWTMEDIAGTATTTGLTDNSITGIPALTFDRELDPALNPSTPFNLRVGIDNLFYWNNIMHDISYQYGFDEAAGNFQASNQGRGGLGNDFVYAFAEDGAGINNADFATPPDGQAPRMRMFQWNSGILAALHIANPSPALKEYTAVESSINQHSQLTYTGPKTGDIIQVNETAGTHFGCSTITNAGSLVNNIALIDRGSCNFTQKIKTAQEAGAIAVILVNNTAAALTPVIGSDNSITIPAIMVSMADGDILKANLAGLNGTISATGILRDGALDNGIITHEYTHGISNRLTGGPSNAGCLTNAEQMGEGWSDYFALMVTTNWEITTPVDGLRSRPLATYAQSQSANMSGNRRYPYSTDLFVNPWTYDMMAGINFGEPHAIGEIWCATIWDMTWNIILQEGIDPDLYHGTKGNNIALQLVMEGMKYQPCSPGFLDARDAILKADSILYNYVHKCAIWKAFARRGMGKSASQGSSASFTDQVAATDLPVGLSIKKSASKTSLVSGDNITYTIKAYCDCAALSNISIIDTLSGKLAYLAAAGGTYTKPFVHFDGIDFAPGETKTFTIQATVTGAYAAPEILIDDNRDATAYPWTTGVLSGATNWIETSTKSHSSSHAWFAADPATVTDFTLTSGDFTPDTIATLSFWHYFETQPAFDGGLVEISSDGGSSWQDLGPYMILNPYNGSFDPSNTNTVANRRAFSGSSGGTFIQTVVALTDFAGATVRIRFRFSSNGAAVGDGWYIDDILLKNEKGISNKAYAYNGASLLAKNNSYALFDLVALPVHFSSFVAQKQSNSAWLHWMVSDEINVVKYVIERSADGRTFNNIGELNPGRPTAADKDYYFTDDQPLTGNNYYRIAEKDLDGKTTLSVSRLVRFGNAAITVRLLPVPTYNQTVQLEIENANGGSFAAYLLNTVGQVIKIYNVKAGINQLNLQQVAKGVYYVKIELGEGRMEVRKLVVQ